MRTKLSALVLLVLSLIQPGCTTGFQFTGPRGHGVAAEAGVGRPIVIQEREFVSPPPPTPLPCR